MFEALAPAAKSRSIAQAMPPLGYFASTLPKNGNKTIARRSVSVEIAIKCLAEFAHEKVFMGQLAMRGQGEVALQLDGTTAEGCRPLERTDGISSNRRQSPWLNGSVGASILHSPPCSVLVAVKPARITNRGGCENLIS
jgi:hypothetical protein